MCKILQFFTIVDLPKKVRVNYRYENKIYEAKVIDFSEDYYLIKSGPHKGNFLPKYDVIVK